MCFFCPFFCYFKGGEPTPRAAADGGTGGGVHEAPRADQLRSLRARSGDGKLGTERFHGRPAPPGRFLRRYALHDDEGKNRQRGDKVVEVLLPRTGVYTAATALAWCDVARAAAETRGVTHFASLALVD